MSEQTATQKIFLFPGSTLVALEVVRSLRNLPGYKLFGGGTDLDFRWAEKFEAYYHLPHLNDLDFGAALRKALEDTGSDFLYPTNDVAILRLSELRSEYEIPIVTHPQATVRIASSKKLTNAHFLEFGISPRAYREESEVFAFPLFFKPDFGHSSIGTGVIRDSTELSEKKNFQNFWEKNLVTEFLPGNEVTVDCFSTAAEGLVFHRSRVRTTTQNGVSIETQDLYDHSLDAMARTISSSLEFSGAWFFQAKQSSNGVFKLMEIGARIAGFSSLRRAQGVNLAHMSVLETAQVPLRVDSSGLVDEAFLNGDVPSFRSKTKFGRLFVDLDDTLICGESVNSAMRNLILYAKSSGAHVVAITRARYNPWVRLEELRLAGLFHEIIHITDASSKESHIPMGSLCLFIDDSFSERASCSQRADITAADPSIAESVEELF